MPHVRANQSWARGWRGLLPGLASDIAGILGKQQLARDDWMLRLDFSQGGDANERHPYAHCVLPKLWACLFIPQSVSYYHAS
jgi:hypothetical protein